MTTSNGSRQLVLALSITGVGAHRQAWRSPQVDPLAWQRIEHYRHLAREAERGTFDLALLPDSPDVGPALAAAPPLWGLDPSLVLTAMAGETEHLGLIASLSTSFDDPYNVARRTLSLDHISDGRAGFNAVTTLSPGAAPNFGLSELPSHDDRYGRAHEFMDVVLSLWDGWEEGAVVSDPASGTFADTDRIHPAGHVGPRFSVGGALALPRSPQGRPIICQAGASEHGRDFAARYADVVYTVQLTLEDAQEHYRDLKQRARDYGRDPDELKILVGIAAIVEPTDEAARARQAELDAFLPSGGRLAELAYSLGTEPSRLRLDGPLPADVIASAARIEQGSRGFAQPLLRLAERGATVQELLDASYIFLRVIGSPQRHADLIEQWFRAEAADGFVLNAELSPLDVTQFVDLVVPLLRDRGLLRREYTGRSLRDNLGLARPRSRWVDRVTA